MNRQGVVLVSEDAAAFAFLENVLEEHAPDEGHLVEASQGKTCLAVVSGPRRRRLVVIDGSPRDISPGTLIESIRVMDAEIPIVFVRYDRANSEPTSLDGVHVLAGPVTGTAVEKRLGELLRESHGR